MTLKSSRTKIGVTLLAKNLKSIRINSKPSHPYKPVDSGPDPEDFSYLNKLSLNYLYHNFVHGTIRVIFRPIQSVPEGDTKVG